MSARTAEVRRARPLLGTLVEITAAGSTDTDVAKAVEAAFACVSRVHRLMSFHRRDSDIGRLNRLALHQPVRVHYWTWRVLATAHRLSVATRGVFDITSAGLLVRWGYLPKFNMLPIDLNATWNDVLLLPDHRIRFNRSLLIDLGGIAKGFAVDRAIEALRAGGATSALVNAGGDLRAYGAVARVIHLRNPECPGALLNAGTLTRGALATSAHYFSARKWRRTSVTPLVDLARRRASTSTASVTVTAPTCMLADALTKIAMLRGPGMVRRLGGHAMFLPGPPANASAAKR